MVRRSCYLAVANAKIVFVKMPCYSPINAYRGKRTAEGKESIVFKKSASVRGVEVSLPCGQCIGCRLERARQWSVRILHEAQCWPENSFLTLTYEESKVPVGGGLQPDDMTKFLKRLRKENGGKIRYFQCGEYGDKMGRPHHHAIVFNYRPSDCVLSSTRNGKRSYGSESLSKTWGKGFVSVGDVNADTAGYVARYTLKKITGDAAEKHYDGKHSEYATMSRRPGIGDTWFKKFSADVYPSDDVIVKGKQQKPPKFYDRRLEKMSPEMYTQIKENRKKQANKKTVKVKDWQGKDHKVSDNNLQRLKTREEVKRSQLRTLTRPMEEE